MRVKTGPVTRRRHKKWKKAAEGTWGVNHSTYRNAKQTVIKSSQYAYRDRKNKKRTFRKLWILRINAATRELGYTYSQFINAATKKNVGVNRKMLSEMAIHNPAEFKSLVESVMK